MAILYLHGKGSQPGGLKSNNLRERGYRVDEPPQMPDEDFTKSVEMAQQAFIEYQPQLVIGSSRGGGVAMAIDIGSTPLILLAPSWRNKGLPPKVPTGTIIVHSANDEVIPLIDSQELRAASRLAPDQLRIVGEGHFLHDDQALEAIYQAVVDQIGPPA